MARSNSNMKKKDNKVKESIKVKTKQQIRPVSNKRIARLSDKDFKTIWESSCGTSGVEYRFRVNFDSRFNDCGKVLYRDMIKKNIDFGSFSIGHIVIYLKRLYAWYLFQNGGWENANNNIMSCASYFLPQGYALFYKQNSVYQNKKRTYTYIPYSDFNPEQLDADIADSWYGYGTPSWEFGDYSIIPGAVPLDAASVTADEMSMISKLIRGCYSDAVLLKDVKWGAVSGEMFSGEYGSSLTKVYNYTSYTSLVDPYATEFTGFHMSQQNSYYYSWFILDILLNSRNDATSIANVLRYNGYDPMMLHVDDTLGDGKYLAQIMNEIWTQVGGTDADFRMWNLVCWSYIGSYLPLLSSMDPGYWANPVAKDWKMPWAMVMCAKQTSMRVGSTYYMMIFPQKTNWTTISGGRNSFTDFPNDHDPGHPGFQSNTIGTPVYCAPDVNTAYNSTYTTFSWTNSLKAYSYLVQKYPKLVTMGTILESDMADCACFSTIVPTSLLDDEVNNPLGLLGPKVIYQLKCSGKLPLGMCKVAAGINWRTDTKYGGDQINNSTVVSLSSRLASALVTVISASLPPNGTNIAVLEAAKTNISHYVYETISGGYDWKKFTVDQIKQMAEQWVVGEPTLEKLKEVALGQVAKNLPEQISVDQLAGLFSTYGWPAIQAFSNVLATKFIGVAKNVKHNEL